MLKGVLGNGLKAEVVGPVVRIESTDVEAAQVVIDGLRAEGVAIRRMQQMRPSLEDLFVEAVGGAGGGHQAGAARQKGGRP
jgi:ABC-type uncharacterized transport system ATPase subunit